MGVERFCRCFKNLNLMLNAVDLNDNVVFGLTLNFKGIKT